MKNLCKSAFVFLAAMTLLTSCSDDSGSNTDNGDIPETGTYINAKIDGDLFETMSIQGFTTGAASKTGIGDQTLVTISAVDPDTNTMVIALMGVTGTGTYDIGPETESVVSYVDTATETAFNSSEDCTGATGELKVTHYSDEKIEGTFTFTGKNDDCSGSKNVTNGKFRGVFMQN